MSKYKKGAFAIILIIFIISLSLGGAGFYLDYMNGPSNDNPNKLFHYNDKLYFYDNFDNLLGTYECNYINCNYARDDISKDEEYKINYPKLTNGRIQLKNKYAFIADFKVVEDSVKIINVNTGNVLAIYDNAKNYDGLLENNYIVSKDGKYGIITIENDEIQQILEFEYDFIGTVNNTKKDDIKLVVNKSDRWSIIDIDGNVLNENIDPIVDFNDNIYITYNENYKVYSKNDVLKLYSEYKDYVIDGDYLSVTDTNDNYYIYDIQNSSIIKTYKLLESDKYSFEVRDNTINIYNNGNLEETIEL